jgi:hypothetical protein
VKIEEEVTVIQQFELERCRTKKKKKKKKKKKNDDFDMNEDSWIRMLGLILIDSSNFDIDQIHFEIKSSSNPNLFRDSNRLRTPILLDIKSTVRSN